MMRCKSWFKSLAGSGFLLVGLAFPASGIEETGRSLLWEQPFSKSAGGRVQTNVDRGFDSVPFDERKLLRSQRRYRGKFNTAIWPAPVKGRKLGKRLAWDLSDFTGIEIYHPKFRKRAERAISEAEFSSAVQMYREYVGVLNVPSTGDFPLGAQSWAGAGIAFKKPIEDVWSEPGQGLAYSVDQRIYSMSGFVQNATRRFIPYSGVSPQLWDRTSGLPGKRIWLVTQTYDARGFQGFDGYQLTEGFNGMTQDCPDHACDKAIIATSFLPGMNYVTFDDAVSARASKYVGSGDRHFEVTMTYEQLQLALLDAVEAGAELSTNPADYAIVEFVLHNEIHVSLEPAPADAHLGVAFKNMRLEQVTYE